MTIRRLAALLTAVLVAAACSGAPGAVESAGPSQPTATIVATSAAPSSRPTVAPTPFVLGPSEPRILYGWFPPGGGGGGKVIFLARPDGTDKRWILDDIQGDLRAASWSPDGSRIAFVVRNATWPDGAIWTSNADGTDAALFYDGLADGCESVFHPVWSPDGSRISLVCYHGRDADLAILDLASMELTTLASYPWPEFLDNPVSWSSDGKWICFDILTWDPTDTFIIASVVVVVPADGSGEVRTLTEPTLFGATPVWGPDDEELVFNSYDLGNMHGDHPSDLYAIAPDGSGLRRLTHASEVAGMRLAHPQWDPDGTRIWISYARGGKYHPGWVDPATGNFTLLDLVGAGPKPRPVPTS